MIPKYNWKNQYYNLLIRRFPKGYIIHIDGVEKLSFELEKTKLLRETKR